MKLRIFGGKEQAPLVFPGPEEAFGHACLHQSYRVDPEAVIPALVLERGRTGGDGESWFLLRLADRSGGIQVWAPVLPGAGHLPVPGEFVGFRVVRIAPEIPRPAGIIGYIAYSFAPVFVEGKGWRITASYVPENLKPDFRL